MRELATSQRGDPWNWGWSGWIKVGAMLVAFGFAITESILFMWLAAAVLGGIAVFVTWWSGIIVHGGWGAWGLLALLCFATVFIDDLFLRFSVVGVAIVVVPLTTRLGAAALQRFLETRREDT